MLRTRPPRIWPSAPGREFTLATIRPPISSVIAGASPLYGMWVKVAPARVPSSSIVRWELVAAPGEPNIASPGFALANAAKSAKVLIGESNFTVRITGILTMCTRPMNSLKVS